jgi:hypothetical protein
MKEGNKATILRKGSGLPVVKKGYVIQPLTHQPFKSALGGYIVASKGEKEI